MSLAREQISSAEPLQAIATLTGGIPGAVPPIAEFCLGGVTYRMELHGRWYIGRGNTSREAAWKLLEVIARRQREIESCL